MVLSTRREVLAATIGIPAAGFLSRRGENSDQFEVEWRSNLFEDSTVTDTAVASDGRAAIATRPGGSQQNGISDILTVDSQGNRVWEWNWPQSESDSLDFVQALTPASGGGVYFAGPTIFGAGGSMLLGKLNEEQEVEWHFTFSEHHSEAFLAAPSSSSLIVIGYNVDPSSSQTYAYGINLADQSVSWETNPLSEEDSAVYSVSTHQDGCILGGESSDAGLLLRISEEGEIHWEQNITNPEMTIRRLTVNDSGQIACIGEVDNSGRDVHIEIFSEEGERLIQATPDFGSTGTPYIPVISSSGEGGYICSWSYTDDDTVFIAQLSEELDVEVSSNIEPWELSTTPRLKTSTLAGEQLVLAGQGPTQNTEGEQTWAAGVSRSHPTQTQTESPSLTDTETPTQRRTSPPSQATDFTPTNPRSSSPQPPSKESTSSTGPGFGILTTVICVLGSKYFQFGKEAPEPDKE